MTIKELQQSLFFHSILEMLCIKDIQQIFHKLANSIEKCIIKKFLQCKA